MEKYFLEEAQRVAKKINELNADGCFVFSLLADMHINPAKEAEIQKFERTIENMKAVHDRCKIDAIFSLGDLAYVSSSFKGSYWTEEVIFNEQEKLRKKLLACNPHTYFVAGNHDGIGARPARPQKWYEQMILFHGADVCGVKDQGYFYVDFPKYKVRAICLMDTFLEKEQESAFFGYAPEQLSWLCREALQTPDGYNVMIFTHITLHSEERLKSQINSQELIGILKAFQAKGTYRGNHVLADFSTINAGNIVTMFGGHDHVQWSGYKWGLPFRMIETPCNFIHMPHKEEGWTLPEGFVSAEREIHTLSEDLWDTVVYDGKKNLMHIIRFGSGEDMVYAL